MFHVFTAVARLESMLFPLLGQQSGIHCQMICMIELLTFTFLAGLENTCVHRTLRSISALEVFTKRCLLEMFVLYKSTFTYLFIYLDCSYIELQV